MVRLKVDQFTGPVSVRDVIVKAGHMQMALDDLRKVAMRLAARMEEEMTNQNERVLAATLKIPINQLTRRARLPSPLPGRRKPELARGR